MANPNVVINEISNNMSSRSYLGKVATKLIQGKMHPGQRNLYWTSNVIADSTTYSGPFWDSSVTSWRPRSFRKNAAVIAASRYELNKLFLQYQDSAPKESIACVSKGQTRVGFDPYSNYLFNRIYDDEEYAAISLDRHLLGAAVGIWLPSEEIFLGLQNTRVVSPSTPIVNLSHDTLLV